MIEVSSCVICDGAIRHLKRALVAPFLAGRIWNRDPFCVDLVGCASCGFVFYNPRLDDAELQRLYQDYRLEKYQRMRHFSEAGTRRSSMRTWHRSALMMFDDRCLLQSFGSISATERSIAFWIMAATEAISRWLTRGRTTICLRHFRSGGRAGSHCDQESR